DAGRAQDAVLLALAALWQRRAQLPDGHDAHDALAIRATINHALNVIRSRRRHREAVARSATVAPAAPPSSASASSPGDAELAAIAWERALQLPDRERDVLLARFGRGLTLRETGAELQLPDGTVATLQRRALSRLRQQLRAHDHVRLPAVGLAACLAYGLPADVVSLARLALPAAASGSITTRLVTHAMEVVLMSAARTKTATLLALVLMLLGLVGVIALLLGNPAHTDATTSRVDPAAAKEPLAAGDNRGAPADAARNPADAADVATHAADTATTRETAADVPSTPPTTTDRFRAIGQLVYQDRFGDIHPAAGVAIRDTRTNPPREFAVSGTDGRFEFGLDTIYGRSLMTVAEGRFCREQLYTSPRDGVVDFGVTQLTPMVAIDFYVFDPFGKPLPDARIERHGKPVAEPIDGQQGAFHAALEPGQTVQVRHADWPDAIVTVARYTDNPCRIAVRFGERRTNRFRVIDPAGQAQPGVAVRAWSEEPTDPASRTLLATTDDTGHVELPADVAATDVCFGDGNRVAGPYHLATGNLLGACVLLAPGESPAQRIGTMLHAAADEAATTVVLGLRSTVIWRVEGMPGGGSYWRLHGDTYGKRIEQPDATGVWRIDDVEPGDYQLELTVVAREDRRWRVFSTPVHTRPGETCDLGTLHPDRLASLEQRVNVTVLDERGQPVRGAGIFPEASYHDTCVAASAVTTDDGTAQITFDRPVQVLCARGEVNGRYSTGEATVPAQPGQFDVVIHSSSARSGRICYVDDAGQPMPTQYIGVYSRFPSGDALVIHQDWTNADGALNVERLAVGGWFYAGPGDLRDLPARDQPGWFCVPEGEGPLDLRVSAGTASWTRGVVLHADGTPAAGVSVSFHTQTGAVTDAEGRFRIAGRDTLLTVDVSRHDELAYLLPADRSEPVVIRLPDAFGVLDVQLADAWGNPLSTSGVIRLEPVSDSGPHDAMPALPLATTLTASTVQLRVPPGRWRVVWGRTGASPVTGFDNPVVEVSPRRVTRVTLTERPMAAELSLAVASQWFDAAGSVSTLLLILESDEHRTMLSFGRGGNDHVNPCVALPPGIWRYRLVAASSDSPAMRDLTRGTLAISNGHNHLAILRD
ncbi:MAG: sigma factor-like helix-turn-helix DNA-binding protein, partial [Planctomycetota bacterium]